MGRMLSKTEELMNAVTHGVGCACSIAGSLVLLSVVVTYGDAWRIFGCLLYSLSLIAVYLASTLSHSISQPQRRHWYRKLDQAFIYLLIAGTFTPFAVTYLRTSWWMLLTAVMWVLALAGFLSKLFFGHRVERVSIALYIALGWIPIFAAFPLSSLMPAAGLWWMLIGGLCYTFGTLFLYCDEHVLHFHAVWHVFVIAGSAWHFFAILLFVASPSGATTSLAP